MSFISKDFLTKTKINFLGKPDTQTRWLSGALQMNELETIYFRKSTKLVELPGSRFPMPKERLIVQSSFFQTKLRLSIYLSRFTITFFISPTYVDMVKKSFLNMKAILWSSGNDEFWHLDKWMIWVSIFLHHRWWGRTNHAEHDELVTYVMVSNTTCGKNLTNF